MSTKRCPTCSSETAIRIILYGMPMGEPDYDIYTLGGCLIFDDMPKHECIECGWKGDYVDKMPGSKREIKTVGLENISKMSDEEIDAFAKTTWDLLTQDNKNLEGRNVKTSTNKKPYQPYQVTFKGSSLLGESNGLGNFKMVHEKLSQLRDKDRAKCYTRWCKACTMYRLKLENDVTGHILKISFPNVIALANKIEIDWNWEKPESEWAKEKGDPAKVFNALVEDKSKPVFYVRLESEEYINMLLGGQG